MQAGRTPKAGGRRRAPGSAGAAHTAAASEFAQRPAAEQRALFERLKAAPGTPTKAIQDLAQVTASIGKALTQALHTDDREMLDDILRETAGPTIAATVSRLSPAEGLQLLQRCAEIFQAQPGRAQEVLPWIKEVVKTHAVFLMSQPEVGQLLGPVQHAIREHLAMFPKLLLLEGRLELLVARLPGYQATPVNPVPLARFTEDMAASLAVVQGASATAEVHAAESDSSGDDQMDQDSSDGEEEVEDSDADADDASLHDSPTRPANAGSDSDDGDEDEEEEAGDDADDLEVIGT